MIWREASPGVFVVDLRKPGRGSRPRPCPSSPPRPVREAGTGAAYLYMEGRPGAALASVPDLSFLGGSTAAVVSSGGGVWEWRREE